MCRVRCADNANTTRKSDVYGDFVGKGNNTYFAQEREVAQALGHFLCDGVISTKFGPHEIVFYRCWPHFRTSAFQTNMNMHTTLQTCRIMLDHSNQTKNDLFIDFFTIKNGLKMGHRGTLGIPMAKSAFFGLSLRST